MSKQHHTRTGLYTHTHPWLIQPHPSGDPSQAPPQPQPQAPPQPQPQAPPQPQTQPRASRSRAAAACGAIAVPPPQRAPPSGRCRPAPARPRPSPAPAAPPRPPRPAAPARSRADVPTGGGGSGHGPPRGPREARGQGSPGACQQSHESVMGGTRHTRRWLDARSKTSNRAGIHSERVYAKGTVTD